MTTAPAPTSSLLLCPELFANEGGIARVSRLYLEALAELSPGGVRLIALNDRSLSPDLLARHNPSRAPLTAVACARGKARFLAATLSATAKGRRRALSTHVHLLPVLALARLLRPGLAWDVVLHGVEAWRPLPFACVRSLRRSRRVYCVSQYTRDVIADREPSLAGRLRVLHNAIDPVLGATLLAVSPADAEFGRILAVSRLAPHDRAKGVDHLIQAMPMIRAAISGASLHIVGDGGDRARLEALAADSTARGSVIFHGQVDEPALAEQFARCSLFALPSNKESFGLVYAEAMNAGRPCLAALSGGAPEVVGQDGGVLVPYGDVRAIAQSCINALQRRWSAETLRNHSALFSAETFKRNFSKLWLAP